MNKPFIPSDKLFDMLAERHALCFAYDEDGAHSVEEEADFRRLYATMTAAIEAQYAAEGFVPAKPKQP